MRKGASPHTKERFARIVKQKIVKQNYVRQQKDGNAFHVSVLFPSFSDTMKILFCLSYMWSSIRHDLSFALADKNHDERDSCSNNDCTADADPDPKPRVRIVLGGFIGRLFGRSGLRLL